MTSYHVIVDGKKPFEHQFDGEPQINFTFEKDGIVYKVTTRAHDENADTLALHAQVV